jgi:hypothetical protein
MDSSSGTETVVAWCALGWTFTFCNPNSPQEWPGGGLFVVYLSKQKTKRMLLLSVESIDWIFCVLLVLIMKVGKYYQLFKKFLKFLKLF